MAHNNNKLLKHFVYILSHMREFSDTTAFKCDFNSYIYLVISFTQKHIILVTKQLLSTIM